MLQPYSPLTVKLSIGQRIEPLNLLGMLPLATCRRMRSSILDWELLLVGGGPPDDRGRVALVARQGDEAGPLLGQRPGDLALEDPQLLLGLLETAHRLVEIALLGRRLLAEHVRSVARVGDVLVDGGERLLRLAMSSASALSCSPTSM